MSTVRTHVFIVFCKDRKRNVNINAFTFYFLPILLAKTWHKEENMLILASLFSYF